MFASGFNINLQVAVTIQLQLYRESCDRAYKKQVYQQELDKKSNATRQTSVLL